MYHHAPLAHDGMSELHHQLCTLAIGSVLKNSFTCFDMGAMTRNDGLSEYSIFYNI